MNLIQKVEAELRTRKHAEQPAAPTRPSLEEDAATRTLAPSPAQLAERKNAERKQAQETAGATRQAFSNNLSSSLPRRLKRVGEKAAKHDAAQQTIAAAAARTQEARERAKRLQLPEGAELAGERLTTARTDEEIYRIGVLRE